jgi:hypothetical protein
MKRILSHGKGAAFRAYPSSGTIHPWSETEIKIHSYNNLVGIYEDTLVCTVGKTTRCLPVRLGVIGSTVKFSGPQLVALRDDNRGEMKFDLVNFGSRVVNPSLGETTGIKLITKSPAKAKIVSGAFLKDEAHPRKNICVENHSPREIRMEWSVFVKHSDITQKAAIMVEDTTFQIEQDESRLSDVLKDENLLRKGDVGILDVTPAVMVIPPFKSSVLTCNFRNCKLGNFEALVLADIAYAEDGGYTYSPQRSKEPGELPKIGKVLKSNMNYDKITVNDLVSVAKLRIKGKCIEPKLSLDVGTKIRIKKNLRKGAVDEDNLKTISFLVNDSDAVCDFWVDAHPKEDFVLAASKSFVKNTSSGSMYELKQKQHMMITVKYVGNAEPVDLFPSGSETKPSSGQASDPESYMLSLQDNERKLSAIEYMRAQSPSLSIKKSHPQLLQHLPSITEGIFPNSGRTTAGTPGLVGPSTLATGHISVHFSNGMSQTIPIVVEGVYE